MLENHENEGPLSARSGHSVGPLLNVYAGVFEVLGS